jgi:sec-independent protein translocase protein TatA
MTFGLLEIGILLFVVFLILGPKRIQNVLGALGRGVEDFVNEFGKDKKDDKKMLGGGDEEDRK